MNTSVDKKIKIVIDKFFTAWQKDKWKRMARYTQLTWKVEHCKHEEIFKRWFENRTLKKWEITKIITIGYACRDVYINIDNGKEIKEIKARVICEINPYTPSVIGNWGINPISCTKELSINE